MSRLRSAVARIPYFLVAVFCLSSASLAQTPSGDVVISANTTWPAASYNLTSLKVQSGAVLTVGGGSSVTVTNGISVTGSSSMVLQSANNAVQVNGAWTGVGVTMQAASVQVDAGSSINADGQGYISNAGPGDGGSASGGSGGSYGGVGGYNPGSIYGSAAMPVDLGSGGLAAQYAGSNGGGAIRLIVSGTLTNNGTISANGQAVLPSQGGAGAGGSVYVTTATLAGSGSFTANGGSNTTPTLSGAAAGGGGRVAVYYAGPTSFTGFSASTASGGVYTGAQTGYAGTNGTAAFFDTSVQNNNVSVYQSGFQIPANTTVQYNSLTIVNAATVTVGSGSTVAVADSLKVQSGAVLTVGGGSSVTVTNGITVTGSSSMVLQSANSTLKVNGAWAGVGVTLQAASLLVDADSSINADGQGYVSSAGPGDEGSVAGGSGGSYGGVGGYYPGATYGSAAMPVELGSGGVAAQYAGSNGGGAIRLIVSGTLTNNGTISANGQAVLPAQGGAGAGGSVYVTTATLAGSGSFTANGGSNTTPTLSGAAAGGGGRVAVYYAGPTTFTGFSASTASGGVYTGAQTGYAGINGTAAFFDTSAQNSNATIYQHYEVPANTSVQYNSLTVANGASVTLGGGSQVAVTQALQVAGTITALAISNTAQINNMWLGKGVVIVAGSVQIDATASINADGQGYVTGAGPGFGSYTTGGSYGGAGGGQDPTSTYGSKQSPVDLGSGGGNGQNTGGGAGGGAIQLLVSTTMTNNGTISANGGSINNSGYGGAGAGGSVFVQTNIFQGSGRISANGGSNTTPNNAGSGGGGGRVSVNYVTNSGGSQNVLTVNAGTGATPGSLGTINLVQAVGLQWLKPSSSAVHDVVQLQWTSNTGTYTTVNAAGPVSSIIAMGGTGISSATWTTSAIPDGAYELRLAAEDASGIIASVSKNIVVNNSVKWVSGTLTANTHWTSNNVYAIEGDVIIPSGITLTIDPGTVVKSLANFQILVQSGGTLSALGDSSHPVIFTTFDDASAGGNTNFSTGIPQPGEWGGVNVLNGGTFNNNTSTILRYGHGALSSTLATNTTLLSSQAYEISGTLTVPSGVTLTVQPGAIIKFDLGAGITVNAGGTLIANGTLPQPIYFTSINDQSVGANLVSLANPNATLTAAAAGDWNSININGTASFNFVHMLYGGGPIPTVTQEGMLESGSGATITLANSTLAYSYYIGIQTGLSGNGDTYTITNTTFFNNQERAINVYPGTDMHIVNCTFDGNAAGPFNHGGMMDIENTVVTGFTNTQFGGIGGPATTLLNNDVYTSTAGVPNYTFGGADPTGTNGNISANPVYMNGPQHDYRPTYGSPLIDAGNGTVANYPLTDAFNDPRYNAPLVTTKKGTADASGKYPDIGALEFVQSAPSDLDLTVSAVQGPASAVVGTQAQVTWTVTNLGAGTVYGPWHDGIYLVRNPNSNPVEIYAGQVLSGLNIILGPGATYKGTATVTVPGTSVGEHSWEVKTNVLGEVFEGVNTANNKAVSLSPVQVDVPLLATGAAATSGSFIAAGQAAYYKIVPSATQAISIQLALLPPATGSVQLFVGAGYVPTPQRYDYQQVEFNSASASVVIPSGSTQTYYITAYPQILAASPTAFTIIATASTFSLNSVSPNRLIDATDATLTFVGGGFSSNTSFKLVGSTGTAYSSTSVFLSDSSHAQVTFSVSKFPNDTYTAEAIAGATVTLANAVYILQDSAPTNVASNGTLQTFLQVPQAFRYGFPALVKLNYTNISGSDLPAPMIYISSQAPLTEIAPECDGCSTNLPTQYGSAYAAGLVMGINKTGPAGVLPPGASGSISFLATPTIHTGLTFNVSTQTSAPIENQYVPDCSLEPVGTVDCPVFLKKTGAYATAADFCSSLTPPGTNPAGYTRACMLFFNKAGFAYIVRPGASYPDIFGHLAPPVSTGDLQFKGFNKVLADDATALSASGVYEYDVQRLLAYEFQKDSAQSLATRYHQGAFGYGASHAFDITFSVLNGTPVITYPDGNTRAFSTRAALAGFVYLGPVGDYGTIAMQMDNSWLLTEPNGTIYHFLPDGVGLLDYIQDRAGNRIQLTHDGKLLSSVTDAMGNTASFQYDANGHITSVTDAVGRVTKYTYKTLTDTPKSTFLTSVSDASGITTLTWNMGGSHGVGYIDDSCVSTYCEPAIGITEIAYPDGTHSYFTYDAAGRLTGTSRDGGAETTTYAYNSDGSTTVTDALEHKTTLALTSSGNPLSTIDPLGNIQRFRFDAEGKMINFIGSLGDSIHLTYDNAGNSSGLTTAVGNFISLDFGGDQLPMSITDPAGDTLSFVYDTSFNLSSQADPAGRATTFTYDSHGKPLTRTNRRGQTTTYTYTANGHIATQTLSTGAQTIYTYDGHNNLMSAATPAGATSFFYDAADHLTGVTNPDGTTVGYTYNAAGQKIGMTDSTGYSANYTYDAVGRLTGVTNNSGESVATYTYDAGGQVTTKMMGNGTSSAYTYDANGNTLSVINYSASHAALSEYDYTYDAKNRPVTETTPTGTLSYSYDLDGQLTQATTPGGSISYAYDANGNRTTVTTNGSAVSYLSNNTDEYESVNGTGYAYDADGNLISGNGYTYTYDEYNQMLTMVSATDSWSFSYDGLGFRVGSVHNGVVTRYLNDLSGYGNVAAMLSGTGALQEHFTYGLELTSMTSATGAASFYHFDATGNATQLTNASGNVVNSYVYLPFGEKTTVMSGVQNPFTYSGRNGATDEGSGLYFMRSRWYNPTLGRFHEQDPNGYQAGLNQYRYVANSPVQYADPTGNDTASDVNNSGWARVYNAVSPFLPVPNLSKAGITNAAVGTVSNSVSVRDSVVSRDLSGVIHDGTLYVLGSIAPFLTAKPVPGPLGVLQGVVKYAGTIDQVSQVMFSVNQDPHQNDPGLQPGAKAHDTRCFSCIVGDNVDFTPPDNPIDPLAPCGICIFVPGKPTPATVQGSIDPNSKLTSGFGDQGFVPSGAPITYTIYFENQPTATLPAQKVVVTDALAANLDWSTVQLNQINFNNVTLQIPDGTQTYSSQAIVATDSNPVSVAAALNPATGLLTWTMQSVDPITGGSPTNPLAGFLPPDGATSAGVGSLVFTVKPKSGLGNGTAITNQASIIFDVNAPILTNTVTNTIDSSTVSSAVAPLPAITMATASTSFPVSWSGADAGGSGIASYDIYVAVDGGAYMLWLSGTTLTTANYTAGAAGHSYSFISFATNNVGIPQTILAAAQTTAVVLQMPTVTVTPAASTILPAQPLSVTVTVTGTGTPTGTVTLTSGAFTSAPAMLSNGTATVIIPAATFPIGVDTLTATYTPDTFAAFIFMPATGSATIAIGPTTSQVTVGTTPAGLSFTVDGTAYTATQTLTWTIGSTHTIATTSPQTSGGVQQSFFGWSDNGALSHTVTAVAGSTTYTASFNTAYLLTLAANPTTGGSVTPTTGTYYPAGTMVSLTATPATGYSFTNWTGAVANSTSAATTIAVSAAQTVTANFTLTPAPVVTLTPAALTFTTTSGLTSAAQTVQLTNTGTAAFNITAVTLSGTGASAFKQTNTCGSSVAPGANCTLSLTFAPTSVATFNATLLLTSNVSPSPTVTLIGTGTAAPTFTMGVTPASQTISQGGTATYAVSLTPQGGAFDSAITLTATGFPSGATATFTPSTVTPGSAAVSSTLTIQVPRTTASLSFPGRSATVPLFAVFGCILVATRNRRRLIRGCVMLLALLYVTSTLSGCASSHAPTTSTSTITITATAGSQIQTLTVSLTVQ